MSWSWWFFAWGVLVGPAWVIATMGAFRLSARYIGGDGTETTRRFARRYPVWAAAGIPFGVMSAVITSLWPDLVFSAYAVVSVLAPLAIVPRLRRTAKACESGGVCTTCPIACDRRIPAGS